MKLLPIEPVAQLDSFSEPRVGFTSGTMRVRDTSLLVIESHQRLLYPVLGSPVFDVVLLPLNINGSDFLKAPPREAERRPTRYTGPTLEGVLRTVTALPARVRIVIAVTGMSSMEPAARETAFRTLCGLFTSAVPGEALLVPVSVHTGEGFIQPLQNAAWYTGPTLVDALATPAPAPCLPPSEAPLLLVLRDSTAIVGDEAAASEVWVRVFRRALAPGRRFECNGQTITITAVHVPGNFALEGSVVRVTFTGTELLLGDVLDEAANAKQAYKTELKCRFTLHTLPPHCPLLMRGLRLTVRSHLCAVEATVGALLEVTSSGGQAAPSLHFGRSTDSVVCTLTLAGGMWVTAEREGQRRSGFDLVLIEVGGTVIGHGSVLLA